MALYIPILALFQSRIRSRRVAGLFALLGVASECEQRPPIEEFLVLVTLTETVTRH